GAVAPDVDAAHLGDPLRGSKARQRLHRRHHDVDRVGAAQGLRKDVADAGRLDDGAHRSAGDDARALRGRAQEHLRRPKVRGDRMRDGAIDEGHEDKVLLRVLDALLDRLRNFIGLAQTSSDVPAAVANDDHRGEAEAAATLDDLGDTVDLNDALGELQTSWIDPWHYSLTPAARTPSASAFTLPWYR